MSLDESKKHSGKMFNEIYRTYDRANHILSGGLDFYWRKKLTRLVPLKKEMHLLDCATGTGDQLLSLVKNNPNITRAVGVDIADKMLSIAQEKILKQKKEEIVSLLLADICRLPLQDSSFDCVTISFGIRNVADYEGGLKQLHRVLKQNGRLLVLEFSLPKNPTIRACCLFYLRKIMPKIGSLISRNKNAYVYLNQTIESFPYGPEFCSILEKIGFQNVKAHPMTFGCVTLYQGDKI